MKKFEKWLKENREDLWQGNVEHAAEGAWVAALEWMLWLEEWDDAPFDSIRKELNES